MINATGHSGVAIVFGRCGMGELGARETALATPDPGTRHSVRITEPEGAVAQMMPWSGPLWSTNDRVSFSTAGA